MFAIQIDRTGQRSMERDIQKRARAEDRDGRGKRSEKKNKKKQQPQIQQNYHHPNPCRGVGASCSTSAQPSPFLSDGATLSPATSDAARHTRPTGLFEFPWMKERLALDVDGWNFRDVFFSSLVDGCSARIGLPGDRLDRRGTPFTVRLEDWPWTLAGDPEEPDGADCIWNCALQQPLLAAGGASSAWVGGSTDDTVVAAPATANAS